MQSQAEVEQAFGRSGLTSTQVEAARQAYGVNRLTPPPRLPVWRQFLSKFNDPIIKILVVAVIVSLAVAVVRGHGYLDTLVIALAVFLATGVSFASEYRSNKEFDVLNAEREKTQMKVVRDGQPQLVPAQEIVAGDLLLLEAGDGVAADAWVLAADALALDESVLTGEPEPAERKAGGAIFRGTHVAAGTGQALVAAVGDATKMGELARSLDTGRVPTPLEQKLAVLAQLISKVGYAGGVAIAVALFAQGWFHHQITGLNLYTMNHLVQYFMMAVVIIVVAVPEGLPMSVTLSLVLAMRKMTRSNALVRRMVACETMGAVTTICTDKTGTLTKNQMEVVEHSAELPLTPTGSGGESVNEITPGWAAPETPGAWIALNAALNSTAHLDRRGAKTVVVGNSTEGALLRWLSDADLDYEMAREAVPRLRQLLFNSDRKRMSTVVALGGQRWVLAKGAPEILAALCTDASDADDAGGKRAIERDLVRVRALAGRAMRTLAFAHRVLAAGEDAATASPESLESGLVWDGFVGIRDQIREDVYQAVRDCRTAGITVRMVTGDNPVTARAIAEEVGILADEREAAGSAGPDNANEPAGMALAEVAASGLEPVVMAGSDFRALSDAELNAVAPHLRVLARAEPLDKLRLVRALQAHGQVVAVTGDGTNDAPALKSADVGLSMGKAGTEVAREASDIVLLDDGFPTIAKAVWWGRALYENIQRFLQFQLTVNVGALLIAFLAPLLGFAAPFTVVQLLWINIVMDSLAALALCSEAPHAGLLAKPPLPRGQHIITVPMARTILVTGLFYTAASLAHLYTGFLGGDTPAQRGTALFAWFVLTQVWNGFNCRAIDGQMPPFFRGNPTFFWVMGSVAVVQVLLVQLGGAGFGTVPLPLMVWAKVLLYSLAVLVVGWGLRLIPERNWVR